MLMSFENMRRLTLLQTPHSHFDIGLNVSTAKVLKQSNKLFHWQSILSTNIDASKKCNVYLHTINLSNKPPSLPPAEYFRILHLADPHSKTTGLVKGRASCCSQCDHALNSQSFVATSVACAKNAPLM
jgi:hypothetical protein